MVCFGGGDAALRSVKATKSIARGVSCLKARTTFVSKRVGFSPDLGDAAAALTFAIDFNRATRRKRSAGDRRRDRATEKHGWGCKRGKALTHIDDEELPGT